MKTQKFKLLFASAAVSFLLAGLAFGQDGRSRGPAKPVTVPVTVRVRDSKLVEMRIVDYLLREDGEMQQLLSIRPPSESPMTLALLRLHLCKMSGISLERWSASRQNEVVVST